MVNGVFNRGTASAHGTGLGGVSRGPGLCRGGLFLDADAGIDGGDVVGTCQQRVDVHLLDFGSVV